MALWGTKSLGHGGGNLIEGEEMTDGELIEQLNKDLWALETILEKTAKQLAHLTKQRQFQRDLISSIEEKEHMVEEDIQGA